MTRTMTSAINQELGRIAGVQHHAWGIRNHAKPTPLSFKEWLLRGMKHYKQDYGFTFELVTPSLMRIVRPEQPALLRTCEDFRREYENEYLIKF